MKKSNEGSAIKKAAILLAVTQVIGILITLAALMALYVALPAAMIVWASNDLLAWMAKAHASGTLDFNDTIRLLIWGYGFIGLLYVLIRLPGERNK